MFEQAEKLFDEEKYDEALRLYEQLEEQNHAEAIYSIGWCYENGLAVEQDYGIAIAKYKKAYSLGHAKSAKRIGYCYEEGGYGVDQDIGEALSWFEKAASNGVTDIYHKIGTIYCDELNDQASGKAAFEKGVELGEADCLAGLGQWYLTNEHSIGTAWEYAEKADKAGSIIGTSMLHTIFTMMGKYEEAFDVAVKIVRRFNGKFEDKLTDIAAQAYQNDCGVETALNLAQKYYDGVDGKIYYTEASICISYAMKNMNDSISHEMHYNVVILASKLFLDPNSEVYNFGNAVTLLKEYIKYPDCKDEIKFMYAKCLYNAKESLYNPTEAKRIMDQLAKKGYADAVKFLQEMKPTANASSGAFKMVVDDTFTISGRGNVLTGTVENAGIAVGDSVDVMDESGEVIENAVAVLGIERLHKLIQKAEPSDAVGILLRLGLPKQVHRGCYLVKSAGAPKKAEMTPRQQYMAKGLCAHCGGSFKGLFSKKCSSCGKPKDY